jgi:hypothetical protein
MQCTALSKFYPSIVSKPGILQAAGPINFIRSNKRFAHWSVGNYVLAFEKESGELSSQSFLVILPGGGVELEYVLELSWPPTFPVILC